MQAGIYARMSRDAQGDRLGVDRQLTLCRTLATSKGWTVEPAHEYVDNDVSASTSKRRPRYEDMLADIRSGLINAVIVYDLDRLARRPIEIEHFITLADEHHLALASIGEDVDLSTDNGRLFARIKGAVARAEVERKSARQKDATMQAVQMGKQPQRRAFGYPGTDQRPGTLRQAVSVPAKTVVAEAEAVRQLYAGVLAGDSLVTLTRQLNETGFTTTRGGPWGRTMVRALLLNPRYAGLRTYRGEIHGPGNWEPLIPEEQWRAVRALLTDGARTTNRHTTARLHLLGGLALCGICADGTTVKTGYGGGTRGGASNYRVYTCRKSKHISRRADHIDEYVTAVILDWASTPAAAAVLAAKSGPDIAELRQEAAALSMRLDQMAEDFADGTLSREQMRAGSERARLRLAEAQRVIDSAHASTAIGPLVTADPAAVWEGMSLDRRRQAISMTFTVTLLPRPVGTAVRPRFDPDLLRIEPVD